MSPHQDRLRDRPDLTGEHAFGDTGQTILALLFALVWVADSFFLQWTTVLNDHVNNWVRAPLGLVALILAGYLARQGMQIVFGEVRDEPRVIRKGVFGVIRHPIYVGEALLYVGLVLLSLSLAAAVVALVAVVFLHYLSRWEERLLLARFGDAYRQYMREVPMWLPRLRRRSVG